MPGAPSRRARPELSGSPAKGGAILALAILGTAGLTWSILRATTPAAPKAPAPAPPRPQITLPEGTYLVGDDGVIYGGDPAPSGTPSPDEHAGSEDPEPAFGPPQPTTDPAPNPAADATPSAPSPSSSTPNAPPPAVASPPTAASPSDAREPQSLASAQTINLNTATQEQLQLLPAIGPARARAIIEDRTAHGPFRTVDDLDRVRGIGPAIIEGLRRFACVN